MTMTTAEADKILSAVFAPWVLELGLPAQALGVGRAIPRPRWSERLPWEGGGLSGQALTAAADTATVPAVPASRGAHGLMTTVQRSPSLQRPVTGSNVLIETVATTPGPPDGVRRPHSTTRPAGRLAGMTDVGSARITARADTVHALRDRHGRQPAGDGPSCSTSRILPPGNLHIGCPTASPRVKDLHTPRSARRPLARSVGFAPGAARPRVSRSRPPCEEVATKPCATLHQTVRLRHKCAGETGG
jgi:hypothetical protein